MTNYELIKNMTIEELAEIIYQYDITDAFCKSNCDNSEDTGCPHPVKCCVIWLSEPVGDPVVFPKGVTKR